jgi:hypothetical protein
MVCQEQIKRICKFSILSVVLMAGTSEEWAQKSKRLLKAELKRSAVGYAELARRLTEMGLTETEGSVSVKVNRGSFPAWFLLAVMNAIGVHTLRLHEPD